MGKQINFFFTAADWAKVAAYLDKKDFCLLPRQSPERAAWDLKDIGDPAEFHKTLCLKSQQSDIVWNYNEFRKTYSVDLTHSPCISMWTGMDSPDSVFRGRFYYDADFIANGERVAKNEEFLEAARVFFNWVRRNFQAVEAAKGFYASGDALKKKLVYM